MSYFSTYWVENEKDICLGLDLLNKYDNPSLKDIGAVGNFFNLY